MLQAFRDHITGWIAGIIVFFLCTAFALWGIQYYLGTGGSDNVIAKVDGAKITASQLNNLYNRLRQNLSGNKPLNDQQQQSLKELAQNQLVTVYAQSQFALKHGYAISPQQLDATIQSLPAFQVNGQFSSALFARILNSTSYSVPQFENDFTRTLLISQIQTGIQASAFLLPSELKGFVALNNQTRSFNYMMIPASHFSKKATVTDDEINQYYNQHKNEMMAPAQVSIDYIELSPDVLKDQIKPTQDELKQFYQNNVASFTTPESWLVAHILLTYPENPTQADMDKVKTQASDIQSQLKSGADFTKLAAQYSTDKTSADKGGVLNWIYKGQQPPVVTQALSQLQNGQITSVTTPQGIEIYKLLDHKMTAVQDFDAVQDKVRNQIIQQQLQQEFAQQNDQLSNLTYTNPGTLDAAAKALNLQVQHTELFTKQGGDTPITSNPQIVQAAFSNDVLSQGNNSDVIQLKDNAVLVLRVNRSLPQEVKPLSAVESDIRTQLTLQKTSQMADTLATSLLSELQSGQNAFELAKQNQLTWDQLSGVQRTDAKVNQQILQQAFNLSKPTDNPSFDKVNLTNGDVAIIQLNKVQLGQYDALRSDEQKTAQQNWLKATTTQDSLAYTEAIQNRAKIKMYSKPSN